MYDQNRIAVNFSPLKKQDFEVIVFRKLKQQDELKDNFDFVVQQRQLPIDLLNLEDKKDYWVSFEPQINFSIFTCNPIINIGLTISYLNYQLFSRCNEVGLIREQHFFIQSESVVNTNKIYFINQTHNSGNQCIWVKADYLEITHQFGFYTDFQFKKNKESKNFYEIQKLSLSVNSKGYANTEFYVDKYDQLKRFATIYYKKVFQNTPIDFSGLQELDVVFLKNKIYQFQNNEEGRIASDLKSKHPFQNINDNVNIYFVYKQEEKYFIEQTLDKIKQVLNDTYKTNANCILYQIDSYTVQDVILLINKIKEENSNNKCLAFLPIQNEKVNYYYQCKYEFDKENIPIQFISHKTLKSNNSFAFDGLTLQIFAKLGGKPWKMKPTNDKCLILGLAQANPRQKMDKYNGIKRFFGYSVLVDSSGLYKSLEVFSNELSKEEYLKNLKNHIVEIIVQYQHDYQKIVIHTPFKIKEEELDTIQIAIKESGVSNIQFVVIRINVRNDYFGYNKQRNSLTAFESSLIKLSDTRFLIWFEGLKHGTDERPNKRFSGPTFVEFHYPHELSETEKLSYIQDIINLSGANWRGFKAKSEPVSIYYCYLVTQFVKQFRLVGYDKLDFKNFQPWFL